MSAALRKWHLPALLSCAVLLGVLSAVMDRLHPVVPAAGNVSGGERFEQRVFTLLATPGFLDRALAASQRTGARLREAAWRETAAREPRLLAADPRLPGIGAADAPLRGIVFVDYNCAHCRSAHPALRQLVDGSPDIGVTVLPLALLRPSSAPAAMAVLAAAAQGRQAQLHEQLTRLDGEADAPALRRAAAQAGLDVERLLRDAGSEATRRELARIAALARRLEVSGTPTMLFANGVRVEGAVATEELRRRLGVSG